MYVTTLCLHHSCQKMSGNTAVDVPPRKVIIPPLVVRVTLRSYAANTTLDTAALPRLPRCITRGYHLHVTHAKT